jgi:hypothetical protein
MRKVVLPIAALLILTLIGGGALSKSTDAIQVTVHEWGTFTSVAGVNGEAMPWRTYGGRDDLPCFVERFGGFKGVLLDTVRMETPVLYFYSPRDLSASVKVGFPKGTITEWYPKAALSNSFDSIEWSDIKVAPNAAGVFPSSAQSHYYAARETDAAPLQVGLQQEKFLFYRGVGNLRLPISAKATQDGKVLIKNLGTEPIRGVILFENHDGHVRHQVPGALTGEIGLDSDSPESSTAALLPTLEDILVDQGLYRREAKAMIETWRDSWFEEGTRLFYIVPRRTIDSALPLTVQPAPSQMARVFVGRMEIVTQAVEEDVQRAIANRDRRALEKYGRFLEPIAQRMGIKDPLLDAVYSASFDPNANCGR